MKLGIIGARGRMGKAITFLASQDPFFETVSPVFTQKEPISTSKFDILIDFSAKDALLLNLQLAKKTHCPIVIGTTGLDEHEQELLIQTAKEIPIFWAPNFSFGMAVTAHITKILSSLLKDFTPSIEEVHHIHKKDTPSGSALALKEVIETVNPLQQICIKSQREGETIGKHTVSFTSAEESITFYHEAFSRDVFAKGALIAAKFLLKQKPGLYNMEHLIKKDLYIFSS